MTRNLQAMVAITIVVLALVTSYKGITTSNKKLLVTSALFTKFWRPKDLSVDASRRCRFWHRGVFWCSASSWHLLRSRWQPMRVKHKTLGWRVAMLWFRMVFEASLCLCFRCFIMLYHFNWALGGLKEGFTHLWWQQQGESWGGPLWWTQKSVHDELLVAVGFVPSKVWTL